jgi:hypothetical protein
MKAVNILFIKENKNILFINFYLKFFIFFKSSCIFFKLKFWIALEKLYIPIKASYF